MGRINHDGTIGNAGHRDGEVTAAVTMGNSKHDRRIQRRPTGSLSGSRATAGNGYVRDQRTIE